jgi:hypothetical protein
VRLHGDIDGNRVLHWIARWGFAAMVGAAVVASLFAGVMVAVPSDVPAIALQAPAVYRLEVGGAIFAGLYVVTMAFVLALQNRAFTEIGTRGVRAQSLSDLPGALMAQEGALNVLLEVVDELEGLRDHRNER